MIALVDTWCRGCGCANQHAAWQSSDHALHGRQTPDTGTKGRWWWDGMRWLRLVVEYFLGLDTANRNNGGATGHTGLEQRPTRAFEPLRITPGCVPKRGRMERCGVANMRVSGQNGGSHRVPTPSFPCPCDRIGGEPTERRVQPASIHGCHWMGIEQLAIDQFLNSSRWRHAARAPCAAHQSRP
jgi:hypothetical protein